MKQKIPIRPCKGAVWNKVKKYWEPSKRIFSGNKRQVLIGRRSPKKARQDIIYRERRKWFLADPDNTACPVAEAGLVKNNDGDMAPHFRATTQIHHKRGRLKYYLAEETWLAVSAEGHSWIHNNVAQAKALGWMLSRE